MKRLLIVALLLSGSLLADESEVAGGGAERKHI